MTKSAFCAVTAFLVLGAIAFAGGQAEPSGPRPLVVGMELQYPPFEMPGPDGQPTGISVDLARAFGEWLGRPVEIRNIEWTGLIPALRTGSIDMIISSMTITEERRESVDFSAPYAQSGLTLLVNRNSPIETPADLERPGIVLAVKSGTTGALVARDNYPNAQLRLFDTTAACVLEVAQGKADAFIYDALTVYQNWSNHSDTTRVVLDAIPGTFGYWGAALQKGSPLVDEFNTFLREFRGRGGFDRLSGTYLNELKAAFDEMGVPFFFDIDG